MDAGVLIEAAIASGPKSEHAFSVLWDTGRVFLSCPFLDFELLPQAIRSKRTSQLNYLEEFLASTERIEDLAAIFKVAFDEAIKSPISGIDALHIAAAHLLNADEFITTEKPGKPIYKNSLVQVLYLYD